MRFWLFGMPCAFGLLVRSLAGFAGFAWIALAKVLEVVLFLPRDRSILFSVAFVPKG